MGRGKGFAVEGRTSGLEDRDLCLAVKPKLLTLLGAFAERGYVYPAELEGTVGDAFQPGRTSNATIDTGALQLQVTRLEEELRAQTFARGMLEEEVPQLTSALANEREKTKEAISRIAALLDRLDDSHRISVQIIAASRQSLESLRELRGHLKGLPYAQEALSCLVGDMKQVATLLQELRTLDLVRRASGPPRHHAQ